ALPTNQRSTVARSGGKAEANTTTPIRPSAQRQPKSAPRNSSTPAISTTNCIMRAGSGSLAGFVERVRFGLLLLLAERPLLVVLRLVVGLVAMRMCPVPRPGRGDDVPKLGVAGLPAELRPDSVRAGDQRWRVAGTAVCLNDGDGMAGHLAGDLDYLPVAVAMPVPQV